MFYISEHPLLIWIIRYLPLNKYTILLWCCVIRGKFFQSIFQLAAWAFIFFCVFLSTTLVGYRADETKNPRLVYFFNVNNKLKTLSIPLATLLVDYQTLRQLADQTGRASLRILINHLIKI